MRNTLLPLALAGLLTTTGLACAQTATAPDSGIKPLGSVVLPSQLSIDGIPFGGISGLEYNPAPHTFVAISDDKSEMAPARFNTLGMDLTSKGFTELNIRAVHELRQPDGTLFPVSGTDSESIRFAPGAGLVWSGLVERARPEERPQCLYRDRRWQRDRHLSGARLLRPKCRYDPGRLSQCLV